MVKAQVSGSVCGTIVIQDINTDNTRTWMGSATIRFLSLAEPCHTQKVKMTLKMKTTSTTKKSPKMETCRIVCHILHEKVDDYSSP